MLLAVAVVCMAKRIMEAYRASEGKMEVMVNTVYHVTCENCGIVHICQGTEG